MNEILYEKNTIAQHEMTDSCQDSNNSEIQTVLNNTTEKSGLETIEIETKQINQMAGKHINIKEISPNNFNIFSNNKELATISVIEFNKRTACLTSKQKKLLVAKRRLVKNRKYAEKSQICLDIDIQKRTEILNSINQRNSLYEKTIKNYKENIKNLQGIINQIKKYFN